MQVWVADVCWSSPRELWMGYCSEIVGVVNLVEGYFLCSDILHVPYSTVCEHVPLDLQFTKHFLQFTHDMLHSLRISRQLEIVDMFGHRGRQPIVFMTHAQFCVYQARLHVALLFSDSFELH